MRVELENRGDVILLRIHEQIDITNSPELKQAAAKALSGGISLVALDFTDVPAVDSSGIGAIIKISEMLKQTNGRLTVFGLNPRLKQLFKIMNLQSSLKAMDTEQEALSSLGIGSLA
jgi:anti-anti-sigma factor